MMVSFATVVRQASSMSAHSLEEREGVALIYHTGGVRSFKVRTLAIASGVVQASCTSKLTKFDMRCSLYGSKYYIALTWQTYSSQHYLE